MDHNLKYGFWIVAIIVVVDFAYSNQVIAKPLDIYVDLIAWKLSAAGSENWAQDISPEGTNRIANVLSAPFKLSTGARFEVNKCDFFHTDWCLGFNYTWYQTTALNQASVTSGGIYSPFSSNFYANNTSGASFGPNYRNASLHWKCLFNIMGLDLAHPFKLKSRLLLLPCIGLKAASIRQYIDTTWQNPNPETFFAIPIPQNFSSATEKIKNNFYGLGPNLGLRAIYKLSSVELLSDFSAALMCGHWSFYDRYQNNNNVNINTNVSNINGAAFMLRGRLGLAWGQDLSNFLIKVNLSYEEQVWFNQLQYYNFNMGRLNNQISLQGIALGVVVSTR